jgi:hypothetical protein
VSYRVPDGAVTASPVVTTATGTVTGPSLPVTFSVTGFSPTLGGPRGTVVTVKGAGFTPSSTVKFGTKPATSVTYVSPTALKAVVPADAVTSKISVLNAGSSTPATSRSAFTVTPSDPPAVNALTPTSGPTGQTVTIDGSGFFGTSKVQFGTRSASFSIVSGTRLTATVPNGASTAPIKVTTAVGTAASAANFTVTFTVKSFAPSSGPVGTDVTINGAGFTRTSVVRFNGVKAAAPTFVSTGRLVARVPAGATTGPISVTTSAGTTTSATSFTVT